MVNAFPKQIHLFLEITLVVSCILSFNDQIKSSPVNGHFLPQIESLDFLLLPQHVRKSFPSDSSFSITKQPLHGRLKMINATFGLVNYFQHHFKNYSGPDYFEFSVANKAFSSNISIISSFGKPFIDPAISTHSLQKGKNSIKLAYSNLPDSILPYIPLFQFNLSYFNPFSLKDSAISTISSSWDNFSFIIPNSFPFFSYILPLKMRLFIPCLPLPTTLEQYVHLYRKIISYHHPNSSPESIPIIYSPQYSTFLRNPDFFIDIFAIPNVSMLFWEFGNTSTLDKTFNLSHIDDIIQIARNAADLQIKSKNKYAPVGFMHDDPKLIYSHFKERNSSKYPLLLPNGLVNSKFIIFAAHRGAQGHFPQSSLPAFEAGLDNLSPILETDVHLSRDGYPILYHPSKLEPHRCISKDLLWSTTKNSEYYIWKHPFSTLLKFQCSLTNPKYPTQGNNSELAPVAQNFIHNFTTSEYSNLRLFSPISLGILGKFLNHYIWWYCHGPGIVHDNADIRCENAKRVIFYIETKREQNQDQNSDLGPMVESIMHFSKSFPNNEIFIQSFDWTTFLYMAKYYPESKPLFLQSIPHNTRIKSCMPFEYQGNFDWWVISFLSGSRFSTWKTSISSNVILYDNYMFRFVLFVFFSFLIFFVDKTKVYKYFPIFSSPFNIKEEPKTDSDVDYTLSDFEKVPDIRYSTLTHRRQNIHASKDIHVGSPIRV